MDEEREIDLVEVIRDIIKNYKKLLLISVVFAVAIGAIGGIKQYNSRYTTANLLVIQKTETVDNVVIGQKLSTNDIKAILGSNVILDQVYDNCNFNEELDIEKEKIDYSSIFEIKADNNSSVFTIDCKLKDTELAKKAIENLTSVFTADASKVLQFNSIELISGPTVVETGLLMGVCKYALIGAFVGAIAYCAYVFMKHVFDNLVRSESEIKDILNYHTISYKDSKNTEEIINLLQRKKAKVINFIDIDNNGSKVRLIDEIAQELKNSRKKVKVVNTLDGKININKDKKNYDYLLINCDSTKKSHDFVNVAKIADNNMLVIEKEKAKFEDLETLKEDINLYEINIAGTVFINK